MLMVGALNTYIYIYMNIAGAGDDDDDDVADDDGANGCADAQGTSGDDDDVPLSCSSTICHPIVWRTTPAPTTTATTSAAVTSTTGLIGTTRFYPKL